MKGIYAITNVLTGDWYVGSSANITNRWISHWETLSSSKDFENNPRFQRAWRKYGRRNFFFEVIEEVDGDLLEAEQRWLDIFFPTGALYNLNPVAGRPTGRAVNYHHSDEVKKRIGAISRATKLGKKYSQETRQKMSASRKLYWERRRQSCQE